MSPPAAPKNLALLIALLVAGMALAGCHDFQNGSDPGAGTDDTAGGGGGDGSGDDDDDGDDENGNGDGGGTSPPPSPPDDGGDGGDGDDQHSLTITPQNPPSQKIQGEASSLTVTVAGDSVTATSAGLRWSTTSTAGSDPEDLTTGQFSGSRQASGNEFGFPGEYAVTGWTIAATGTYYVRAHVVVSGADHWSDEFVVEVVEEVEALGNVAADHTVNIATDALEPCGGDNWDPVELTISLGESVRWRNQAACPHTATSGSTHGTHDGKFDTGSMQAGGTAPSESFRFNKTGTYQYYCEFHSTMGLARIVVEA